MKFKGIGKKNQFLLTFLIAFGPVSAEAVTVSLSTTAAGLNEPITIRAEVTDPSVVKMIYAHITPPSGYPLTISLSSVSATIYEGVYQSTQANQAGNYSVSVYIRKDADYYSDVKRAGANRWNMWEESDTGFIDEQLAYCEDKGLSLLRIFIDDEFERTLGTYNNTVLEKIDYIIRKIQDKNYGIKLELVFFDAVALSATVRGSYSPYLGPAGTQAEKAYYFYDDSGRKAAFKARINHILNHKNKYTEVTYKDDPTLFAWGLANEPEISTSVAGSTFDSRTQKLKDWVTEMSAYVKSIDRNSYLFSGTRWKPQFYDTFALKTIADLDVITVHYFGAEGGLTIDDMVASAASSGKPVICEEFGFNESYTRVPPSATLDQARADNFGMVLSKLYNASPTLGAMFWQVGFSPLSYSKDGFEFWTESPLTISTLTYYSGNSFYGPFTPVSYESASTGFYVFDDRKAVDYFETYETNVDSRALKNVWTKTDGTPVQVLVTTTVHQGSKAMECKFDVSGDPWLNGLIYTFDSSQDWSGYTSFTYWLKGDAGNNGEHIKLQLQDPDGAEIGKDVWGELGQDPWQPTKYTAWTEHAVDISTWTARSAVKKIKLIVVPKDYGSGKLYFDEFYISKVDVTPPAAVSNLVARTGTNGGEISLQWTAPGDDGASGTSSGYLVKYSSLSQITSALFGGASTYTQLWSPSVGGSAEAKTVAGLLPCVTYYFAIKAYDGKYYGSWSTVGVNSANFAWAQSTAVPLSVTVSTNVGDISTGTISIDGGRIAVSDGNSEDGETSIDFPGGALAEPVVITIQVNDINLAPRGSGAVAREAPVAMFNFGPNGLIFNKPVTITLRYLDLDNNGIVDGTDIDENKLRIFWWDGFSWPIVGSQVDSKKNTVTAKVMHFSSYALFPMRELSASDYRPKEKIITPQCKDNVNDAAHFDSLNGLDSSIRIYDITGRRIKTINQMPYEWDGTDEDKNIVESGVYIYQFRAVVEGKEKVISGMLTVAK